MTGTSTYQSQFDLLMTALRVHSQRIIIMDVILSTSVLRINYITNYALVIDVNHSKVII
jgi:hypothetical protein